MRPRRSAINKSGARHALYAKHQSSSRIRLWGAYRTMNRYGGSRMHGSTTASTVGAWLLAHCGVVQMPLLAGLLFRHSSVSLEDFTILNYSSMLCGAFVYLGGTGCLHAYACRGSNQGARYSLDRALLQLSTSEARRGRRGEGFEPGNGNKEICQN